MIQDKNSSYEYSCTLYSVPSVQLYRKQWNPGWHYRYAAAFLKCFHMTELNEDSDSQSE